MSYRIDPISHIVTEKCEYICLDKKRSIGFHARIAEEAITLRNRQYNSLVADRGGEMLHEVNNVTAHVISLHRASGAGLVYGGCGVEGSGIWF